MADGRGLRIALVAAGLGLAAAAGLWALRTRGPELAPDFVMPDLQGQATRLSALRGQVVLLNLWTTWCPPCRDEMPAMERLWQQLRPQGFVLLAVSQDEKGAAVVEPFVRQLGLTFPVLLDPAGQVGRSYGVWGYPESFLIDREGRLVERVVGPREWTAPEQVRRLEQLLAAGGAAAAAGSGGAVPAGAGLAVTPPAE